MKGGAGAEVLVRVEVKPSLAALRLGAGVPGDSERLITAAGECDEILLQRIDAECIGDFIVARDAIRPIGMGDKFVAGAREGGDGAEMLKPRAVEIAEDRGLRRLLHGLGVMRAFPAFGLGRMAAGASLDPDEGGARLRLGGGARGTN